MADNLEKIRADRKAWLAQLEFFDAFCALFLDSNSEDFDSAVASPERLLAEMDRNGVARAMVYHLNAPVAGAAISNDILAQALPQYADRLIGIYSILPVQCPEQPSVETLLDTIKQQGFRALTLYPAAHRWLPNRLTIGRLVDAATERRVPIYLTLGNGDGSWRWVYDFMKEFPQATTIVTSLGLWGADRNLRPLLETYPNLHAELSQYWVPEGITDLVKLYGSDRLLYGSGMPRMGFGSNMLNLVNLQLPKEEIEAIAAGNLKRLINWN